MPTQPRRKTGVQAAGLRAAAALCLATFAAAPASAVNLKPGDIVVGTYANNSFGSGNLFVIDPVAGSVTEIPNSSFVSGVGALAIDNDLNIVVGSYSNSTFGGGQLYRVNTTTNAVTTIGNTDYFNGVSSMHVIDSNTAIVGTAGASTFGEGALYSVDLTSGAATRLGNNVAYSNGVGAIANYDATRYLVGTQAAGLADSRLYLVDKSTGAATTFGSATFDDSVAALTVRPNGQIILGSQSNAATGTGRLYNINPTTGAASTLGFSTFFNGVTALTTDLYGNVVMGTGASTTNGAGQLYFVDPTSGVTTPIVGDLFAHGISALAVVGPQADFTGGNNVTIGALTDDVIGDPDFFSTAESASLNVTDLLTALGNGAASVRTGSGGTNSEPGNLTVAANLDFDSVSAQTLTLRASNDITIDGSITDSAGGDDELNLTLVALNPRQYPGITSGTGAVAINAAIALNTGSFSASGVTFANAGGTIQSDSFVLNFTGDVALTQAIDANNVAITAGSYTNNGVAFNIAGDFNLTVAGDVNLAAAVTATDVTTTGDNFDSSSAPITANGTLTLNHTGTVTLGDSVTAQAIKSTGTDFTAASTVTVDGAEAVSGVGVDLTGHTGNVVIDSTFTVGDGGSDAFTGGDFASAGADFTIGSSGELRVSEGVIDLSRHTGVITIDGVADSDVGMVIGTSTSPAASFTSNGSVNINADVTAFVSGGFAIQSPWDSASLTVAAQDFTFDDPADTNTLSIWNLLDITAQNSVNINDDISVGALTSRGVDFNAPQDILVQSGDADLRGHTGVVTIGNSIEVQNGSFYSAGTDFGGWGFITVSGALDLNHSGVASFGSPSSAGSLNAQVGSFDNSGGPLTITNDAVINASGTVSINDTLDAGSLDATGSSVDTNGDVTTTSGDIEFTATSGDVSTGALVSSAGAFTSTGVNFTSAADLSAVGAATLNHTGDVNLNAAFSADALTATGNTFSFNTLGAATLQIANDAQVDAANAVTLTDAATVGSWTSTGGDFTVSAGLESTSGDIDASGHAGAVAIDGVTTAAGSFSSGGTTFANSAALTADGDVNLTHSDTVAINAAILAGAGFSSAGTSFTATDTIDATSGSVDVSGHSGAVSFGALVTAGDGFSSAGTTFVNTAAITAGGAATLNHSDAVTINAAFASAGLDVQSSASFSNTGGALTIAGSTTINSGSTVDIDATVDADDFTSTGAGAFTNTAAITTDSGGVAINHPGQAVAINAGVSATGGGFASTGSTFTNTAAISASGAANLTHTGTVSVNAGLSAASLSASGSTFANTGGAITLTGPSVLDFVGNVSVNAALSASGLTSSGADFTGNAVLTTTTGGVDLTGHTGSVVINSGVTATTGGFAAAGSSFDSNAAITVGGASSVHVAGPVTVNAAFGAGSLNVTGSSFDNTGGALTTAGATTIDATGTTTLAATANAGSFTAKGSSVTTNAAVTTTAGGVALDGRSGAVAVNAAVTATGGGFTSNGSTFTSAAPISATGPATLTHTGAVTVNGTFAAASADISGASFRNTGGFTAVGNMLVAVAGNVDFDANVSAGAITSSGVNFDSRGFVTTIGDDLLLNHSGTVRMGNTTADLLDLGNAAAVILDSPAVVDVNNLDVTGVTQTTINTGATLDVAGAFTQTGNTVTLSGGLLRTSDLQTNAGTFNFYFGEVHVTTNLDIGDGFASERVLGLTPDVTSGQTLRVTDTTTLFEPFFIRGGTFITGKLVNRFLLNFEYGTLRILADAGDDLIIGNDGQYGPQYALGRTGSNQQILQLYAGDGGAGSITVRSEGTLLMEGGKAYAQGGIFNSGRITLTDELTELSGGTLTNQSGGRIQGTGTIVNTLVNQAGGTVIAANGQQVTFTGAGGTNAGSIQSLNGGIVELLGGFTNQAAGVLSANNGVFNVGTLTSYSLPWNATGKHLNNFGQMQFAGQSTVNGDVVMQPGSKMTISGAGQTSIFGRLYGLTGELRASTADSRIVVFQPSRGFFTLTGSGEIKFEGGLAGLSPAFTSSTGILTFEDNSADQHMITFTLDGTRRADAQLTSQFGLWSILGAASGVPDDFRSGTYGAIDANVLKLFGNSMSILVELWGVHGSQNPDLYTLKAGDTFELLRFNSIEVALSAAANPHDLVDLILPQLGDGLSWHVEWDLLTTDGDAGSLTLTVIPEPATALLAAPLLFALTARRRRAA